MALGAVEALPADVLLVPSAQARAAPVQSAWHASHADTNEASAVPFGPWPSPWQVSPEHVPADHVPPRAIATSASPGVGAEDSLPAAAPERVPSSAPIVAALLVALAAALFSWLATARS